jgi:hypothetical protein
VLPVVTSGRRRQFWAAPVLAVAVLPVLAVALGPPRWPISTPTGPRPVGVTTAVVRDAGVSPGVTDASPGVSSLAAGVIRADQDAVVRRDHQPAIDQATEILAAATTAATGDRLSLARDRADAAAARSTETSAQTRSVDDLGTLGLAIAADRRAQAQLAEDRSRLRAMAVAAYTGDGTGSAVASVPTLGEDQEAALDRSEVGVVANLVITHLVADRAAATAAATRHSQLVIAVNADQSALAQDSTRAEAESAQVSADVSGLADAQARLTSAQGRQTGARTDLGAALAALTGPGSVPPGQLSLVGSSALDGAQLVAWYDSVGYTDLTSTPVAQLASWYLQAGVAEGVRGDVAFAQAVLETGGFSSSDAAMLNNYAGIGHCDTCATGWAFPSPHDGVVGQLQLLRIFAGAPSSEATPPVLPALTPARQGRAGCCQTWQALTGVWATDPRYGTQILSLYEEMLTMTAGAGGQPPAADA